MDGCCSAEALSYAAAAADQCTKGDMAGATEQSRKALKNWDDS